MTNYQYAIVLIVSDHDKSAVESFGMQLGHSGHEYSVPLSANGDEPVTHWALNTLATPAFAGILSGTPPPGIPQVMLDDLISKITISVRSSEAYKGHFADVIDAAGLQQVTLDPQDQGI